MSKAVCMIYVLVGHARSKLTFVVQVIGMDFRAAVLNSSVVGVVVVVAGCSGVKYRCGGLVGMVLNLILVLVGRRAGDFDCGLIRGRAVAVKMFGFDIVVAVLCGRFVGLVVVAVCSGAK